MAGTTGAGNWGLIAGNGDFPFLVLEGARSRGIDMAVIAIKEDGFFPLSDIEAEQKIIPKSELKTVSSAWGHLALFGTDPAYNERIDAYLKELLAS